MKNAKTRRPWRKDCELSLFFSFFLCYRDKFTCDEVSESTEIRKGQFFLYLLLFFTKMNKFVSNTYKSICEE